MKDHAAKTVLVLVMVALSIVGAALKWSVWTECRDHGHSWIYCWHLTDK